MQKGSLDLINSSYQNCSLKGSSGNQKWFFLGITVKIPFWMLIFKSAWECIYQVPINFSWQLKRNFRSHWMCFITNVLESKHYETKSKHAELWCSSLAHDTLSCGAHASNSGLRQVMCLNLSLPVFLLSIYPSIYPSDKRITSNTNLHACQPLYFVML